MADIFEHAFDELLKREAELLKQYEKDHTPDSEKESNDGGLKEIKLENEAVLSTKGGSDGYLRVQNGHKYIAYSSTQLDSLDRPTRQVVSYVLGNSNYNSEHPFNNTFLEISAEKKYSGRSFEDIRNLRIDSPLYSERIEDISGSNSLVQYMQSFIESVESRINDGTIVQAIRDGNKNNKYIQYNYSDEDLMAFAKKWLHDTRLNFAKLLEDMPDLGIKLEEIGLSDLQLAERQIEKQGKMLATETARADAETTRADTEATRAEKAEATVADLQTQMAKLQKQLADARAERDTAQSETSELRSDNERLQADLDKSQSQLSSAQKDLATEKATVADLKKKIVAVFTSLANSFKKKPTFGGHKHEAVQQGIKDAAEAVGFDMSKFEIRSQESPTAPTGPEDR